MSDPFKRGIMAFEDYNYTQYNPYVLVPDKSKEVVPMINKPELSEQKLDAIDNLNPQYEFYHDVNVDKKTVEKPKEETQESAAEEEENPVADEDENKEDIEEGQDEDDVTPNTKEERKKDDDEKSYETGTPKEGKKGHIVLFSDVISN